MQLLTHALEGMAWMDNCIPLFHVDAIAYPCPNLSAILVYACK